MSAEDDRTKETATVLAKVSTAAFPADGLAPWMSHYGKKEEAMIVGIKTIADVGEELDRQIFILDREHEVDSNVEQNPPSLPAAELEEEEFDTSKLHGAAYIFAFGLNRLAMNMHNFAPSIDGMRTKQAIALARANNPGMATPTDEKKKSSWKFWQKEKKPE